MKRINKIATILVAISMLVGCEIVETIALITSKDDSTFVNYWVSFENKTQHSMNVTMVFGVYSDTHDYVIEAGEHFRASLGTNSDDSGEELAEKLHDRIIPQSVHIVYDNKYSISFERDSDNDYLCKLSDYQMLPIHEYATACHYDFTEEDYEYAKTHGTVVGIEE